MILPQRSLDYFLVVGKETQADDALMASSRIMQPQIRERYPKKDLERASFPNDAAMFAFPNNVVVLELEQDSHPPPPASHCFVMTEEDGTRVHAAALVFYEFISSEEKISLNRSMSITSDQLHGDSPPIQEDMCIVSTYEPRALVITSHWPFFDQMKTFLHSLYRTASSEQAVHVPLERVITNFVSEVPLPPAGRIKVDYTVPFIGNSILFSRPPPNEPPLFSLSFTTCFQCLSVDTFLRVFSAVLTEKRLLFISSHMNRLVEVQEAILHVLYPLLWRQIYIPLLPKRLIDFVCAPMPFMIGIHRDYLPDAVMLAGVFVVDLDASAVMTTSEDESGSIPPLPEKQGLKLQRNIKKFIAELPKGAHDYPHKMVNKAFMKFFVGLLEHFRDHMEAPSESVIDKFRKAPFLATFPEKDQHFVSEFLDTQMFQCFVDERYELKEKDLGVLYFDECIERQNKKTKAVLPFLDDTSNVHKDVHRVEGPLVDDPEFSMVYESWPATLKARLLATARPPTLLFDASEEQESGRVGISHVAMKFFTDKNMFAGHFHSLQIRSSKQDLAFRDILGHLKQNQLFLDASSSTMADGYYNLNMGSYVDTNTSVDIAWAGLVKQMEDKAKLEARFRSEFKTSVFLPMYKAASNTYRQLQVLFREAKELDTESSKQKAQVDSARKKHDKLVAELAKLEATSSESFSTPFITQKSKLEGELYESLLHRVEFEASFRKLATVYQERMKAILLEVRHLNESRLFALKGALGEYVKTERVFLQSRMDAVTLLEERANKIDIDSDMKTFREANASLIESDASANEQVIDTNHHTIEEARKLGVRSSLEMWGPQGFQIIYSRSLRSKATVKACYNSLEASFGAIDQYSKGLAKLSKQNLPKQLKDTTQFYCWSSLCGATKNQSVWVARVHSSIRDMCGKLRVLKGIIKASNAVAADHKARLELELKEVEGLVIDRRDKRDKLNKECDAMQVKEEYLAGAKTQRLEEARVRCTLAENDFKVAKRQFNHTFDVFDISVARMMDTLQSRDIEKAKCLQKTLQRLFKMFQLYTGEVVTQTQVVQGAIDGLDSEYDLQCFVSAQQSSQEYVQESIDFAVHLGDIRGTHDTRQHVHLTVSQHARDGEAFVRKLGDFMDETAHLYDAVAKSLSKLDWKVPTETNESLSYLLTEWASSMGQLSAELHDFTSSYYQEVKPALSKLKEYVRNTIDSLMKMYTQLQRDVEPVRKVFDQAVLDHKTAMGNLDAANAKLRKRESENSKKAEKQASKVDHCSAELEKAEQMVNKAREVLDQTIVMEVKRLEVILHKYQQLHQYRYDKMREILNVFNSLFYERAQQLLKTLDVLQKSAAEIDPISDMNEFIAFHASSSNPPESVVHDVILQKEQRQVENDHKVLISGYMSSDFDTDLFHITQQEDMLTHSSKTLEFQRHSEGQDHSDTLEFVWYRYWDPDSGEYYYVNIETNESQWEPPDAPFTDPV